MLNTKNMQAKPINQKRGPTTGNAGTMSKRDDFMAAKASSGSEKAVLAKMVTDALEMRGRGQAGTVNPALEGLHSNTGPKKNPTADGAKLPGKYKSPK
jgi:hypothetical protein